MISHQFMRLLDPNIPQSQPYTPKKLTFSHEKIKCKINIKFFFVVGVPTSREGGSSWLVQKTKFVKGNISGAPLNVPRLPPPQNLPSVSSDKSTVDFSNEIYFVSDTWNF